MVGQRVLLVPVLGCLRRIWFGLGFLYHVSYIKPIPAHEKILLVAVGKSGPNAIFNPFIVGLGWPWVGEFVGFKLLRSNIYMFSNPT